MAYQLYLLIIKKEWTPVLMMRVQEDALEIQVFEIHS